MSQHTTARMIGLPGTKVRRGADFWAHLAAAAVCAALVPVAAAVGISLGDSSGWVRAAVACVIAALMGVAVWASANARWAAGGPS